MSGKRRIRNLLLKALLWVPGLFLAGLSLGIILYILVRGFSGLTYSVLVSEPSLVFGTVGILPAIANTLLMMAASILFALPAGCAAGILISMYLPNRRWKRWLAFGIGVAADTPPVVYGLVGMLVFGQWLGYGMSLMAGCLTMALWLLAVTAERTLQNYATRDRDAAVQSLALGTTRGQMLFNVVLPYSRLYVLAEVFRAAVRVMGEASLLLFTAGMGSQLAINLTQAYGQSGGTLSVMLYIYAQQRGNYDLAYSIAALMLVAIWVLNGCATLLDRRRRRNRSPGEVAAWRTI